jgi:hypothetical protein
MYQRFPFQGPPKYTQIAILGLKNHMVRLGWYMMYRYVNFDVGNWVVGIFTIGNLKVNILTVGNLEVDKATL